MAGSYSHVTNRDGTYGEMELIENLGDAAEAIEEMWGMIERLKAELAGWLKVSGNVPLKLIDPEKFGHLVNENDALRQRVKELEVMIFGAND